MNLRIFAGILSVAQWAAGRIEIYGDREKADDQMLQDIDGKPMNGIPKRRLADFNLWRSRISDADYNLAKEAIRRRIESHNFVQSSFLPGPDWTHNEFAPLYRACRGNKTHAGWFFGLIVWEVMIEDVIRTWRFLKPATDENIQGMQYFVSPAQ